MTRPLKVRNITVICNEVSFRQVHEFVYLGWDGMLNIKHVEDKDSSSKIIQMTKITQITPKDIQDVG